MSRPRRDTVRHRETLPGQPYEPYTLMANDPKEGTIYRRSFADVTALVEFATWIPSTHGAPMSDRASRGMGTWYGDADKFSEAIRMLHDGWPEGVKHLNIHAENVKRSIDAVLPRPKPVNDVVGGAIDIASYLEGQPEHMMAFHPVNAPQRSVHIVANVSASGGIDPKTIASRGGVIAGLAYALEMMGVPVRCTVYDVAKVGGWGNPYNQKRYIVDVLIKEEGQPVDVGRLAFAIAHPAMLRRIFFGIEENESDGIRRTFGFGGGGYGAVGGIPFDWQGDIYLGPATYGREEWSNPESAVAWVMENLERMGVVADV